MVSDGGLWSSHIRGLQTRCFVRQHVGSQCVLGVQVTAQVYGSAQHAFQGTTSGASVRPAGGHLTAALGTMWAHAVNTRLVLETAAGVQYIKVSSS